MTQLSRSRWAAIGAAVAVTLGGGGLIGVSAAGTASSFVSVDPVRILDTRQGTAGKVDDATIELQVTGAVTTYTSSGTPTATVVPSGATSVSVNLTVTEGVRNGDYGFVTAFPCASKSDAVPNASSLNFVERVDVANGLTVPLSSGGKMCLNVYGAAHLIVDVSGYYTTASAGSVDAYTKAETDALVAPLELAQFRGPVETPVTVDSTGDVGVGTAVAVGRNGFPVIAYYDVTNADLKVVACNDIACDGGDETVSVVDSAGDVGRHPSIAIGATGNPVVAYFDATNFDLKVAACNDPACSGGDETVSVVSSSSPVVGQYPSIAIGLDGNPVISHYNLSDGQIMLTICDDPACSGQNEALRILDDVGVMTVRNSAVTIGANGFPVVAYRHGVDLSLKMVSCRNTSCDSSSRVTATVDNSANVGSYPSITIGLNGQPVVSYYDITNQNLKLAVCSDEACRGAQGLSEYRDIATVGDVGKYSSVRIGANGDPVVAFMNDSVDGVAVLVCRDPLCDTTGIERYLDDGGEYVSMAIAPNGYPVIAHYSGSTSGDLRVAVPWWVAGGR